MSKRMNWGRERVETRDRKQPPPRNGRLHKQQKQQNQNTPPAPSCPVCNFPMARRNGPSGPFWGCHQFPRCKGTRE
jgi:ssDNA-binding Zn-finger/Zn-ribbon topoisomerase 1